MVRGKSVKKSKEHGDIEITKTGSRDFHIFSQLINISISPKEDNVKQLEFTAVFHKEEIIKQKYQAASEMHNTSQISISIDQMMCVGRIIADEERASFDDKLTVAENITQENQDYVIWCLSELISDPLFTNPASPIYGEASCVCDIL